MEGVGGELALMCVSGATSIAVFGLLCCVCSRGAEEGRGRREGGRRGEAHGCAILLSGRYLDTTAMRADHSSVFMDGRRDEEGTERGGEGERERERGGDGQASVE